MPQNEFVKLEDLGKVKANTKSPENPTGSTEFIPLNLAGSFVPKSSPDFKDSQMPGDEPLLKTGARLATGAIPLAGGMLGTALAGPPGGAVGAGVGANVGDLLRRALDNEPAPGLGEQFLTVGKNAALAGAAGKFLGPIEGRLANALANTVFGSAVRTGLNQENVGPKEFATDFATNLGLNLAGEAAGRAFAGNRVVKVPGKPEVISVGEGVKKLRGELTGADESLPTSSYGSQAQGVIGKNFATARGIEKNLYNKFESHVENNAVNLKALKGYTESKVTDATGKKILVPEYEDVQVKGPIYTANASQLAAEIKPMVDSFKNGKDFESLPDYQKRRFSALADSVDKLVSGIKTTGPDGKATTIPLSDFRSAKEMKTIISQTVGGKVNKTLPEGALTKLAIALDKDIDTSVSNWNNGTQALADLNSAHSATILKKKVFENPEISDILYGKGASGQDRRVPADPSEAFSVAFKSPEKTQRLLSALGPEGKTIAKGEYLDNELIPAGFGHNYSHYDPRRIINDLENPNSSAREVFSADERGKMLRFFKAAESSGPRVRGTLSQEEGNISIALGAASRIVGAGYPGSTVVRIGVKEALHKMLDSPQTFEYASRLVKIPPESSEAQSLLKVLMKGLRGSEVTLFTDGKERKGTVGENGRIGVNP